MTGVHRGLHTAFQRRPEAAAGIEQEGEASASTASDHPGVGVAVPHLVMQLDDLVIGVAVDQACTEPSRLDADWGA